MIFRNLIRLAIPLVSIFGLTGLAAMANEPGESNCPVVRMSTSEGDIDIEVYPAKAPATVENFLTYVKDGFYKGLVFHRVIPGFVIQGGGFAPGMESRETRSPIENEADNGLKNESGTLSMARTSDPHSASSQFFINLNDNASLDHTGKTQRGWGYAVFARVIAGMDVIAKIAGTPTTTVGSFQDVPTQDIVITDTTVLSQ